VCRVVSPVALDGGLRCCLPGINRLRDCFLFFFSLSASVKQLQSYIVESESISCLPPFSQPSSIEPEIFTTYVSQQPGTRNSFIAVNHQPHHHPTSISTNQPTLLNASNTNQPCLQAHLMAPTPRTRPPTHPIPPHPQPVRHPPSQFLR
jgi:hypothetical protein